MYYVALVMLQQESPNKNRIKLHGLWPHITGRKLQKVLHFFCNQFSILVKEKKTALYFRT